ncbi:MAG: hypothetical protein KC457_01835, partial [Myxococcales bacterium]|nr:hypothetical protein [Myxococcales bacterium]
MFPGQSSRYPGMFERLARLHRPNADLLAWSSDLLGRDLARYEDAERWQEDARPWTRALGADKLRGEYLTGVGMIARDRGRYEEARATLEPALDILTCTDPRDRASRGETAMTRGITKSLLTHS